MFEQRRRVIRQLMTAMLGLGWFDAVGIRAVFQWIGVKDTGNQVLTDESILENDTTEIHMEIPTLAEDGSMVPIKISTRLAQVRSITVIADNNPVPVVAKFLLGPTVAPIIATRIKLAESTPVNVVIETGQQRYQRQQFVQVIKGGCS